MAGGRLFPSQLHAAVALGIICCLAPICTADFDYFLFTREWPATFCDHTDCKLRPANESVFTIHGLWPQYNNNSWPQFCDPDYRFDETEIQDLLDEMDNEWPSLTQSLASFWKHEWEKHGTCSLDVFPNEHDYFSAALALHRTYDLEDALAADGIVPDPVRRYRLGEIRQAFLTHLGSIPQLECFHGELNEVRMCVTKDLEPFDCPETSRSCPASVKLPPFPDFDLPLKKSRRPDAPQLSKVWNTAAAVRGSPFMAGALLVGSMLALTAAAVLMARRRATDGGSGEGSHAYMAVSGSGSTRLPL